MKINQSMKNVSITFIILVCLVFGYANIFNNSLQMNLLLGVANDSINKTTKALSSASAQLDDMTFISPIIWLRLCLLLLPTICVIFAGLIQEQTISRAVKRIKTNVDFIKYLLLYAITQILLLVIFIIRMVLFILENVLMLNPENIADSASSYFFLTWIESEIFSTLVVLVILMTIYLGTIYLCSEKKLLTIVKETTRYELLLVTGIAFIRFLIMYTLVIISRLIMWFSSYASFAQQIEIVDAKIYSRVTFVVVGDFGLIFFIAIALISINSLAYKRINNQLQVQDSYLKLLVSNKREKLKLVVLDIIQVLIIFGILLSLLISAGSTILVILKIVLMTGLIILGLTIYSKQVNLLAKDYTNNKLGIFSSAKKILFKLTMFIPFLPLYFIAYISFFVMLVVAKLYLVRLLLFFFIFAVFFGSYIHNYSLDMAIVISLKSGDRGYFKSFKWYFKLVANNFKSSFLIIAKCVIVTFIVLSLVPILTAYLLVDNVGILLYLLIIVSIISSYVKFNNKQYLYKNFINETNENL